MCNEHIKGEKKKHLEMCFPLWPSCHPPCLLTQVTLDASRLKGCVELRCCHKTKTPGFNDQVSPHESCVQGCLQLGTVEVVLDQLLSAWLGVNRWTNHQWLVDSHSTCFLITISLKAPLKRPPSKSEDHPERLDTHTDKHNHKHKRKACH